MAHARLAAAGGGRRGSSVASERCTSVSWPHNAMLRACDPVHAPATLRRSGPACRGAALTQAGHHPRCDMHSHDQHTWEVCEAGQSVGTLMPVAEVPMGPGLEAGEGPVHHRKQDARPQLEVLKDVQPVAAPSR